MVQFFLDKGADITVVDADGWSALHVAVTGGCLDMVLLLLKAGLDINLPAIDQATHLHLGVQRYQITCVAALLEHGASTKAYDIYGKTPFDWLSLDKEDIFLKIVASLKDHESTSEDVQQRCIRQIIQRITGQLEQSQFNDKALWDVLGRCLIFLKDSSSAFFSFSQTISFDPITRKYDHHPYCDMCRYIISDTRYVCTTCAKTDLCDTCMSKYATSGDIPWCVGHEFLKVPIPSSSQESDEESGACNASDLTEWVEKIRSIHDPNKF
ncbi:MAG: hypothetical protein M1834_000761 [Cirrosporium novae-zelandiae]|nr:MAG: hypothetical protein M1834_000761 [Cirrosporium novae-zelandiae]